jgi:hypothetical protein
MLEYCCQVHPYERLIIHNQNGNSSPRVHGCANVTAGVRFRDFLPLYKTLPRP